MSKRRAFVGMSGGVDSSVAAKRLVERGYDVVGVFIKVWQPDFIHCDWEKERLDAMRVAAHLGIPFLTMNAEEAYKTHVADYMISEYQRGRTPNPDVMCNEFVKFGAFYDWARAEGADVVATGHYAQKKFENGIHSLHTAIDASKDQSYFLSRISQDALDHALFPIGDTVKADVRKEAARAGLPTYTKKDSQGLCFLGHVDMYDFLSHYINLEEGNVLDESGATIGTHRGAVLYTMGQRHGFTTEHAHIPGPYYVVSRDIEVNTVTVSTAPQNALVVSTVLLTDMNELGTGFGDGKLTAVSRYHGKPVDVTLVVDFDGRGTLSQATDEHHDWVKGQSCVLYRGDECVGSGIIS
jgi:tRNA-specific 2-thiouridylase